jgi:hypothetical protein
LFPKIGEYVMAVLPYPVKATAVFEMTERHVGWTEGLYILNQESLKDASARWLALLTRRVQMLGAGVRMIYTTVSQESDRLLGDAYNTDGLIPIINPDKSPIYNDNFKDNRADYAWSAALTRIHSTDLYHRAFWLAGNPDIAQKTEEGRILLEEWNRVFKIWKAYLTANGAGGDFGMRVWAKDEVNSPIAPIIATNVNTHLLGATNVYPAPGLVIGDKVFVHGLQGLPRANRPHGEYQVTGFPVAPANGVIIAAWAPDEYNYEKGGYFRKRVRITVPITDCTLRSVRERKKGRPLFLLRGRSPARPAT